MKRISTPWGQADHVADLGDGMLEVSTPSHGGIYVPPALNERIPLAERQASCNGQGLSGWYEEDCDVLVPLHHLLLDHPLNAGRRDKIEAGYAAWVERNIKAA